MLIPLNYRVLVKRIKLEEVDEAFAAAKRMGLQVVESERNRETNAVDEGTVVSLGPTADLAAEVQIGDRVIFARYAGKNKVDPVTKEEFVFLNDEDLIGLVKE